jgi:hypothetical protein
MATKRTLKCLACIPSIAVTEYWQMRHAERRAWATLIKTYATKREHGEVRERTNPELTAMRRTGWSATLLFEMPERLGTERMRRLADLYGEYVKAWEDAVWRHTFGEWVTTVEADIAAIARGRRANPKAVYREIPEAQLRQEIWDEVIRPRLPADFVFEFAWLGPPIPEEVPVMTEPTGDVDPAAYFRKVNTLIREAGVARDIAARWTREVIRAQGFDVHEDFARVWDDMFTQEEQATVTQD